MRRRSASPAPAPRRRTRPRRRGAPRRPLPSTCARCRGVAHRLDPSGVYAGANRSSGWSCAERRVSRRAAIGSRLPPARLRRSTPLPGCVPAARHAGLTRRVPVGHRARELRRRLDRRRDAAAVHRRDAGGRAERSLQRRMGRPLGLEPRRPGRAVGRHSPADDPGCARPGDRGPVGGRLRRRRHRAQASRLLRHGRVVERLLRPARRRARSRTSPARCSPRTTRRCSLTERRRRCARQACASSSRPVRRTVTGSGRSRRSRSRASSEVSG